MMNAPDVACQKMPPMLCIAKVKGPSSLSHSLCITSKSPCESSIPHPNLSLMDEFVCAGYRGLDLYALNTCRMYLHAVTLADIVTVSRLEIALSTWEGRRQPHSGSSFSWPHTPPLLSPHYWQIWQCALHQCFLLRGLSRLVRERLGKWASMPLNWQWFYSPLEDRMYHKEALMWRAFPRHLTRMWGTPDKLFVR